MRETIDLLALLGWMDETEAVCYLRQGRVQPEPVSEDEAQRVWSEYRCRTAAAALARCYQPPGCRVVRSSAADRFVASAGGDVRAVVAVDPARLIPFQFYVAIGRAAEHADSPGTWAERCLPTKRPQAALAVTQEGNSLLFDVPHGEHVMKLTRGGELRVEQAHPYVMVGDLGGGRLMLRGGYHRAYAYMLAKPSPKEPFLAALTDDRFTELEIPGRRERLLSPSPPVLADFTDPALSMPATKVKMRFRFKVTVEMDMIPSE